MRGNAKLFASAKQKYPYEHNMSQQQKLIIDSERNGFVEGYNEAETHYQKIANDCVELIKLEAEFNDILEQVFTSPTQQNKLKLNNAKSKLAYKECHLLELMKIYGLVNGV